MNCLCIKSFSCFFVHFLADFFWKLSTDWLMQEANTGANFNIKIPADKYKFNVTVETLEKGVKFIQS